MKTLREIKGREPGGHDERMPWCILFIRPPSALWKKCTLSYIRGHATRWLDIKIGLFSFDTAHAAFLAMIKFHYYGALSIASWSWRSYRTNFTTHQAYMVEISGRGTSTDESLARFTIWRLYLDKCRLPALRLHWGFMLVDARDAIKLWCARWRYLPWNYYTMRQWRGWSLGFAAPGSSKQ